MPVSSSWIGATTIPVRGSSFQSLIDEGRTHAAAFFGVDIDDDRLKNDPFSAEKVGMTPVYDAEITFYLEAPKPTIGLPPLPSLPAHGTVAMGRFAPTAAVDTVRDGDTDWTDEGDEDL